MAAGIVNKYVCLFFLFPFRSQVTGHSSSIIHSTAPSVYKYLAVIIFPFYVEWVDLADFKMSLTSFDFFLIYTIAKASPGSTTAPRRIIIYFANPQTLRKPERSFNKVLLGPSSVAPCNVKVIPEFKITLKIKANLIKRLIFCHTSSTQRMGRI